MFSTDETIAAVASSHSSPGQRGIVRVSGPETVATVTAFFQPTGEVALTSIRAATRIAGSVDLGEPLGTIPCDLHLWPSNRSYTQQPTAELHTYGAAPILNAVLEAVCQRGARLAKPGEFTLRSFLSGRIDLAQAEAVLGVIDAANDRELHVALEQLAGGLSLPLTNLRDTLLNLVADLEAGLDFVDEDIEFVSQEHVLQQLESAEQTIDQVSEQMESRGFDDFLPRVVLRGEPNVGKSSIWNALVDTATGQTAIVDANSGTTRDYLVGNVTSPYGAFALIDTAGIESKSDNLHHSMMTAAQGQAESADLVLLCIDGSRPPTEWEQQQLASPTQSQLIVQTKSDLPQVTSLTPDIAVRHNDTNSIDRLTESCCERLQLLDSESSVVANTATRCRDSLRLARESVNRAATTVKSQVGDELVASELREGLDHLGEVVGAVYTDDVLDRIFSRFCIGK